MIMSPLNGQCDGSHDAKSVPTHRLGQRVVVVLPAPGVLRADRGGQGLQDLGDYRGAIRAQVTGDHPGASESGLDPDLPVLEPGLRVILALRQGPSAVRAPAARRGRGGSAVLRGLGARARHRAAVTGDLRRDVAGRRLHHRAK